MVINLIKNKNLKDAVDQIALEHTMDLKNVVDDIKLNGVLVQFGAKVTWESSDEKYLKIEADGIPWFDLSLKFSTNRLHKVR